MKTDPLPATTAVCANAVAAGKVLGAYLFVWHRGEVVADLAFGDAEPGVPAVPGDVGELRCGVKPLTTLCVAKAVEAGLVSLDDTIARWAPAGADRRMRELSLRRLLTHDSGLPNYFGPDVYALDFDEYVTAVLQAEIPDPMWYAQPVYNLTRAWHLLAWTLQRVHGRPLHELIAESVTRPLGLSSMGLLAGPEPGRPYQRRTPVGGYAPIRDADPGVFAARPNPGFGGFSTAGDLGRLYVHLLRCITDGGLVRPATMRAFVRRHGIVQLAPGGTSHPHGLGFFLGGESMLFGPGWGADAFGYMGSIGAHYANVAFCAPGTQTVVAARLASIGMANNALFAAIGNALHGDLMA